MTSAGASCAVVVDPGDGVARDPHRPRPAHARGRRRPRRRRARVGGDVARPPTPARPTASAGDVLLEMLDRGLRHFPVVSAHGRAARGDRGHRPGRGPDARRRSTCAGVSPPRRSVARAGRVARELRPMVIALHEAQVAAANVMAVYAVCVDALTRRLLELDDRPSPATVPASTSRGWRWAARPVARRCPSSDVDSAIVWFGDDRQRDARPAAGSSSAERVLDGSAGVRAACSTRTGLSASAPPFVRSVRSWQREARSWMADPTQEKALVLSSVLVDSRPVWGVHAGTPVADTFAPRSGPSRAAAPAGALRPRAPAADRLSPRPRRRALRRAPRAVSTSSAADRSRSSTLRAGRRCRRG